MKTNLLLAAATICIVSQLALTNVIVSPPFASPQSTTANKPVEPNNEPLPVLLDADHDRPMSLRLDAGQRVVFMRRRLQVGDPGFVFNGQSRGFAFEAHSPDGGSTDVFKRIPLEQAGKLSQNFYAVAVFAASKPGNAQIWMYWGPPKAKHEIAVTVGSATHKTTPK